MWGYLRIIRPRELSKVNRQPFLACFTNEKAVHRSARKKVFFLFFFFKENLIYARVPYDRRFTRAVAVASSIAITYDSGYTHGFPFPAELTKLSLGSFQLMRQYLTSCESRSREADGPITLHASLRTRLTSRARDCRLFSFLTLVVSSMRG